jgi:hypothetical protein
MAGAGPLVTGGARIIWPYDSTGNSDEALPQSGELIRHVKMMNTSIPIIVAGSLVLVVVTLLLPWIFKNRKRVSFEGPGLSELLYTRDILQKRRSEACWAALPSRWDRPLPGSSNHPRVRHGRKE